MPGLAYSTVTIESGQAVQEAGVAAD
jgi:hypothetical protein